MGNGKAQFLVSGNAQDTELRLKWLELSANSGYAEAQAMLGIAYRDGELGLKKDERKAAEWFTAAAEKDNEKAQQCLCGLCADKNKTEKDWDIAIKWFEKFAEKGDASAMYNVSVLYGWKAAACAKRNNIKTRLEGLENREYIGLVFSANEWKRRAEANGFKPE